MRTRNNSNSLARVNYPLYTVSNLSRRHILVAGGGGNAKTGVPNVFEVYELFNNKSTCRAERVARFDTADRAIMNCTIFEDGKDLILATGMDNFCQLYSLRRELVIPDVQEDKRANNEEEEHKSDIRQRRKSSASNQDHKEPQENGIINDEKNKKNKDKNFNTLPLPTTFSVTQLSGFQTDFNPKEDAFQKVVRFCPSLSLLLTGGTDGSIRVWKYPKMDKLHEVKAHQSEITDMDINPLGTKFVTLSKAGDASVWNIKNGMKERGLFFPPEPSAFEKYTFRNCRFGIVEGNKENACLFTSLNPSKRLKPALSCYLCKWDSSFNLVKSIKTGTDMLSTMTVSDDGKYVGIGTSTGAVDIYIAFSLQRIYHSARAHSIFVTGLEFLKACDETKYISGGQDSSLISISIDNHINIHHIPPQSTISIPLFFIIFVGLLISVFTLLSYLNF